MKGEMFGDSGDETVGWPMRVRLGVIGAFCVACGFAASIFFAFSPSPGSRAEMAEQSIIQFGFYAPGFLLLLGFLRRPAAPEEKPEHRQLGWLLWILGVLWALAAVVSSLPP
jgi:hypothetical protein